MKKAKKKHQRPGLTVATEALIDRGGRTSVSVTAEDPSGAPAAISEVALTAAGPGRKGSPVTRLQGLAALGQAAFDVSGLAPGQQLDVRIHAQAQGRKAVANAEDVVLLAPDLQVGKLNAPDQAVRGTPVNVSAAIGELNGQRGAEFDCVLRVDGQEVDRAAGLWIDDGDSVSCAFTHEFNELGTQQLEVAVLQVAPLDFDFANNSLSVPIEILNPPRGAFQYFGRVVDFDFSSSSLTEGWYLQEPRSAAPDWRSEARTEGWEEQAYFYGVVGGGIEFPLRKLSLSQATAGGTVYQASYQDLTPDVAVQTWAGPSLCALRFDPEAFVHLYVCTTQGGATPTTIIHSLKFAGDITYFSRGYLIRWTTDEAGARVQEGSWAWNVEGQRKSASRWALGSSYRFELSFVDRGALYQALLDVPLAPARHEASLPYACQERVEAGQGVRVCSARDYSYVGTEGAAVGTSAIR